ncbi:MAG: DUF3105 domain-containing protein [Patescibacteria group bacterium]
MTTEHKIIGGGVFLTLIIIVGIVWFSSKEGVKNQEKLSRPMMGEKIADLGAQHIARGKSHPAYNSNPPTSGWHWGDGVAGPGIKDEPVPDELILHSMEHGAAVVWYKDDLEQSDIDKIKEAFNNSSGKKIMLARKDLDVPVALTSWGYLLKLQTIDEVKIKEFIETNNDRAPEKAPI